VAVARKVDKWKTKKKYRIFLPKNFGERDTGIITIGNEKNMYGRKVLLSLRDIDGDKQKQHINLELKINEIEGDKAKTVFNRLIVDRKYLLSRIQPGKTVIDQRYDFDVKNARVISKINVLTVYKIKSSRKHDIILRIPKVLEKYKNEDFYHFLECVLARKVNAEIFKELRKIVPIQRVEIRELKVAKFFETEEKLKEEQKEVKEIKEEHPSVEEERVEEKVENAKTETTEEVKEEIKEQVEGEKREVKV